MNNLKYNKDIIQYFDLDLSPINKDYLINKGLPILRNRMFFFHPTMIVQKITFNNQIYIILGNLSWGGITHQYIGLKNIENDSNVYLATMKKKVVTNIKFINSNLNNFIDFQTSTGAFYQKYYNKVTNNIKIEPEAIRNDLSNLKNNLELKDKLGFNSDYWVEIFLYAEMDDWGDYMEGIAIDYSEKIDIGPVFDLEDSGEELPF